MTPKQLYDRDTPTGTRLYSVICGTLREDVYKATEVHRSYRDWQYTTIVEDAKFGSRLMLNCETFLTKREAVENEVRRLEKLVADDQALLAKTRKLLDKL